MKQISLNRRDRIDDIKLLLEAVLVGTIAGLVAVLYRYILMNIENMYEHVLPTIKRNSLNILILFVVLVILAIIVGSIKEWEKYCGGSGIPQVEAEIKGYIKQNPIKVLFAKIVGGALSALAGLSIGREGPSIQMGAMSGKLVSKLLKRNKTTEKFLLTCGASAGLAAAFNAPVAGILFSIEEVHRHISKKLLVTATTATITADFISKLIYGNEQVFNFSLNKHIPFKDYWMLIVLGIILAFLGIAYNVFMQIFTDFYKRVPLPNRFKPVIAFIISGLMIIYVPQVLGGGSMMLEFLLNGNPTIGVIVILFVVKFFFSFTSFTSGVPGGIFFPILILGATIGMIFSKLVSPEFIQSFIVLSMAGYLTAIVRAPLTAIILIFEMTGKITYLLPLSIVCLISYSITNYMRSLPVYEYLLENLLSKEGIETSDSGDRVLVNMVVEPGAYIENKLVKEVEWPKEFLITNIERGSNSIIPRGSTRIMTGDILHIISEEDKLAQYLDKLEMYCRSIRRG